jgi:hypothetical protein
MWESTSCCIFLCKLHSREFNSSSICPLCKSALEQVQKASSPDGIAFSAAIETHRALDAGTIHKDFDITFATLGLENFEIGDQSCRQSRLVHDWIKKEGHGYSFGFDLKVEQHKDKLLVSFKNNYDFAAGFQDKEIIFVDARPFDDAARNKELRGHLGCHPDNMDTIVNSAAFRKHFPDLQRQVMEAVCSGAKQILVVMVCKSGRHRSVALCEFFHYCLYYTGFNVRAKYNCSEGYHWRNTCGGKCASCCWYNGKHDKPARIKDILVIALKSWTANLRKWKLLPTEEEASSCCCFVCKELEL